MKKTNKKSYVIIALVVLLLAMAIGYAAFTTNLKITGTATANGDWDVHFLSATPKNVTTGVTATSPITTSQGGTTNDTVTVTCDLKKPGDTATFDIVIENSSSVAAKVDGLTITAKDGDSQTVSVNNGTYTSGVIQAVLTSNTVVDRSTLAAEGGTATYTLTFTWVEENSPVTVDDKLSFDITIPYTQAQ